MRWTPAIVLLFLALSGCTGRPGGDDPSEGTEDVAGIASFAAPVWRVGDAWTYESADGARVVAQIVREGVPCASGSCWEILRFVGDEADLAYANATTLGIAPFPVKPGDRWEEDGAACVALDPRAIAGRDTLPIRCEGEGSARVALYSSDARNLVEVRALAQSDEGEGALALRLVEEGSAARPMPADILPVPIFRVGDAWTFASTFDGVAATLRQEVVAVGEPCGGARCYVVETTRAVEGGEETTTERLDMVTLARVVEGAPTGDMRFPLRIGMEWTYDEPADGIARTCIVGEGFEVVCTSDDGSVAAWSWTARGLAAIQEDDGTRWARAA